MSNAKVKIEVKVEDIDSKVEEMNQRKTVVFKQSYKNLDEMKEKAYKSTDGVNFTNNQNKTYNGIGDGIGGKTGFSSNNEEGDAISDDGSEQIK